MADNRAVCWWAGLAAQPGTETVRIAIPGKLVDFAPFYVGAKLGIYRSEGLDPQFIVMRSGIIIPALLAGELDYTTLYLATIRSAVAGIPVRVISTLVTKQSFFLFAQRRSGEPRTLRVSALRFQASPAQQKKARARH